MYTNEDIYKVIAPPASPCNIKFSSTITVILSKHIMLMQRQKFCSRNMCTLHIKRHLLGKTSGSDHISQVSASCCLCHQAEPQLSGKGL